MMNRFEIVLLTVGILVILLGSVAMWVRQRSVTIPMLSLAAGGLASSFGISRSGGPASNRVFFEVATISLAVGLLGSGLELPKWDVLKRWKTLVVLLLIVMPLAWLVTGLLVHLILGLGVTIALLIGACVAPTDPILSRTILLGRLAQKNVPQSLRHAILGESSINDGTGLPFVMLMLLIATRSSTLVSSFSFTLLWGVLGSAALGLGMGWLAARLEAWAHDTGSASAGFHVSLPVALSIVAVMSIRLLGSDGVLGVFFAGVALKAFRHPAPESEGKDIQGLIDDMFSVSVFFLLGLSLPWASWLKIGWPLVVLVVAILVFRRLPWVVVFQPLMKPDVATRREAMFAGWFGPMGVSALFYALLAYRTTGESIVWNVCTAIVCGSVLVHGLTGRVLTLALGREQAETVGSGAPAGSQQS